MKKTEKKSMTTAEEITTATNFELIRESLLTQKSEILNRDSEFKSHQSQFSKFSDEADQTAQELQNNVSIQLHERERKSLLVIEKTLSKFTAGTYGDCEGCGEHIGVKRLMARPMATLCIACMEDLEDSNSQMNHISQ